MICEMENGSTALRRVTAAPRACGAPSGSTMGPDGLVSSPFAVFQGWVGHTGRAAGRQSTATAIVDLTTPLSSLLATVRSHPADSSTSPIGVCPRGKFSARKPFKTARSSEIAPLEVRADARLDAEEWAFVMDIVRSPPKPAEGLRRALARRR